MLPGASTNPDIDIMQWQARRKCTKTPISARVDFRINNNWSSYVRVFHDQAKSLDPQDVSGRFFHITINPTNAIFNLQGILGGGAINEFKIGYNAAPSTEGAETQAGFENICDQPDRERRQRRHRRAGLELVARRPGGLVRVNSAGNGRGAPYNPLLAHLRRFAEPGHGHALHEGGRRRPADSDEHRSAGRDHLHLSERDGVSGEHADVGAVFRRPERTEPVPQRAPPG